jgi:ABC-type molybdate transport system ATPase subunit
MRVAIHSEQPKYNYKFSVADTGIIGVYGVSGCGKSSLLNALAGYNDRNRGQAIFNSRKLEGVIKCSYMNQHPILFPHWTVLENLNFALRYTNNKVEQLDNLVTKLECNKLLNKLPSQLSGGEKQRIAFIRTLLMIENNSLVLLDEPFSALHPKLRKVALDLLIDYKKHCLIFMVTHEVSEIYQYADELLLIEEGSVIYKSSIQDAMVSRHSYLPLASKVKLLGENFVIFADDVSINLEANPNSSISYQLNITIDEVTIDKNKAILKLNLLEEHGNQSLFAKLTTDSVKRLGLTSNQKAVACFKSFAHHSCD